MSFLGSSSVFMISAFWAFVVVWDGKIVLWETLGFLFLYVIYIVVVVFGRFVNQKIKLRKGIVTKNDFRNRGTSERTDHGDIQDSYNGEDDRSSDDDDDEIRAITRPLLDKEDVEASSDATNSTYKKSLKHGCIPLDLKEWNESNLFNKSLIVIKVGCPRLLFYEWNI